MGVVKNVMVRAGADFSPITKQAQKVKLSMWNMESSVSRSCSNMSKAASSLTKAFSFVGAALSVTAVVSAAKSAKAAYDEQAEASAKLAQVMSNTMGARSDEVRSIEDYIDAQERLGVVTGDVQTAGAQELATYLTMSSSLKKLIPVMNDMVAQQYGIGASGESAVSIATMLGKVMNGQTSALSRYGYTFDAAQEAVLKYGNEAQRAAVLAEVVGESVGGMNEALAATPNGRLQQVSNTLGRVQETFGGAVNNVLVLFIPAMNAACDILENVANLASRAAQAVSNVFGVKSAATTAVKYTGAVASAVEDVEEGATAAGEAVNALMGFDQIKKLTDSSSSGASVATGTIEETTVASSPVGEEAGESIGWLEQRLRGLKTFMDGLDFSKLTESFDRLRESCAPLTKTLFEGLSWAMTNVIGPLAIWTIEDFLPVFLDTLGGSMRLLNEVIEPFKPLGSWLWESFLQPIASWTGSRIVSDLESLADGLHGLSDWINANRDRVSDIAERTSKFCAAWKAVQLITFLANMSRVPPLLSTATAALAASSAAQGAHTAASLAGTAATTAFGVAVKLLTSPITLTIAGIAALVAGIVLLVKNWDTAKEIATNVLTVIKSAWGGIGGWFSNNVLTPLSNKFKGFANGIIGFFEGVVNGGISGVNKLISAINKISFDVPDWVPVIGGKTFGFGLKQFSTVKLPRLGTGTVVSSPTAAILGEAGPEAVVPLKKNAEWLDALSERLAVLVSGTRTSPVKLVIPIYVGGRKLAEKVIDDVNEIIETTGVCPIKI